MLYSSSAWIIVNYVAFCSHTWTPHFYAFYCWNHLPCYFTHKTPLFIGFCDIPAFSTHSLFWLKREQDNGWIDLSSLISPWFSVPLTPASTVQRLPALLGTYSPSPWLLPRHEVTTANIHTTFLLRGNFAKRSSALYMLSDYSPIT